MERLEKLKNKLLLVSFVNLLLEYTNTKITNFSLIGIDFILKEEQIINNFNSIFIVLWLYYSLLFAFECGHFSSSDIYQDIEKNDKKLSTFSNNYNSFIKYYLKFGNFFASFKFLNMYLPIIILYITGQIVLISNVYVISVFTFFTVILIYFISKGPKNMNNEHKVIKEEFEDLERKFKKLMDMKEKYKDSNDKDFYRVLGLALDTYERKKESLEKRGKDFRDNYKL